MVESSKIRIALALCTAGAVGLAVMATRPAAPKPIDISQACHPSLSLAVRREILESADRGDELIQFIGQDHLVFVNRSDQKYDLKLTCSRLAHWSPQSVFFSENENVPEQLRTGKTITIPPNSSKTVTCPSGGLISTTEWNSPTTEKRTAYRVVVSFDQKTIDPAQKPVGTLISSVITWDLPPKQK